MKECVPGRGAMWLLLAAAVIICFGRLGESPVYILNESREGMYVRAMLDQDNFVLPLVPNHVECGEIIPDKPPLFHWLAIAGHAVRIALTTGRIPSRAELSLRYDEWATRFPSALCGVFMVMGVAVLGRRLVGGRAAWLAAMSLLASWQFMHQATFGRVDMALACCTTYCLILAGSALLQQSRPDFMLAAVFSGLAVLAKGPLGIVLPGVVIGLWVVLRVAATRSIRWLAGFPWLLGAVIWAAVALPWYLLAYGEGEMALIRSQLLTENLNQFTGANARMSLFYYVWPWLMDSLPWNLAALAGLWLVWRRRDRGAVFCALWWLACMLFFTLSAYKRRAYLLPALPAGALLTGYALDVWLPGADECRERLRPWLAARWKLALGLAAAGAVAGGMLTLAPGMARLLGAQLPWVAGAIAGAGLALAGLALVELARALWNRNWCVVVAALWLFMVAALYGCVKTGRLVAGLKNSPKLLVQRILSDLPAGKRVTVQGVRNDPSMMILFYFPDPARIRVVRETDPLPWIFAPGYYLFAAATWPQVQARANYRPAEWRVLWTDRLRGRNMPTDVVFVEHQSGSDVPNAPVRD